MPWLDDPETIGGWFTIGLMCVCLLGLMWTLWP